ncbi:hypothetical protein [Marinomonas transparens]|uniref:Uncharacterized protein n=1 Tax=Marinomonas transparens TaxID=2795388 RepID=A0A934JLH1_9GAMM|nr:hypothetical protein [Marinomonas transparens]MBJ7536249.1 hypothetical protein [Marinomonas transparens]
MKYIKSVVSMLCLVVAPLSMAAYPSINEAQSCQALVDFVDIKVSKIGDRYTKNDIALIRKGLSAYSAYLQEDVITPGLLSFYGGNAKKAKAMNKLFYRNKVTFMRHLNERYSDQKLITDYAYAINQCAKKSLPKGDTYWQLKSSLETIIRLAKLEKA